MNNREIKFRVWDNVEKIWQHNKGFNQISFNREGIFFPYGTGKSNLEWPNRFIVQQYTGLKDKNNIEIYEGDILKCKGYDDWFDKEGFYYNREVSHAVSFSGETESSGFVYIPIDREVVGNIFQNSALLK